MDVSLCSCFRDSRAYRRAPLVSHAFTTLLFVTIQLLARSALAPKLEELSIGVSLPTHDDFDGFAAGR
jgi:hypothetical protein